MFDHLPKPFLKGHVINHPFDGGWFFTFLDATGKMHHNYSHNARSRFVAKHEMERFINANQ